jgi:hypothetical protein
MSSDKDISGQQHGGMGGTVTKVMDGTAPGSPLDAINADEIARLPYLAEGTRLEAGESYLDIDRIEAGPFAGSGDDVVPGNGRIVAKSELDPDLWSKLTGG